ncbi:MAG TPA: PrsW family intramembrane metalloprotease [Candidatus Pacearchaeota archaeon]|mgnify:CR=1 FL=1|nr:PrsW family intramembrane metalloprotease [Candidatus Parcubacteria bacterium]HNZ84041.1 PrsW family intramembrane metalloprotease [Candidatus Pacearchaeota archaeon]HOU45582.1 PrsW family intramembrane metalloprotease [Candidatus Pacearchaeota archaeon]HPM08445.1 PrsW family intramembrane metalloprotease [Candidatus Pacearchaeota archaeon]HQI74261.1 PrsW family intramembrane metalloprotease [Candidatus Pacearchaeota archaeon]
MIFQNILPATVLPLLEKLSMEADKVISTKEGSFIFLILISVIPSLIWLFHYLGKDINPEPKRILLSIFILGALVTFPTAIIEIFLSGVLDKIPIIDSIPWLRIFIYSAVVIGLVEELAKFFFVAAISQFKCFDEPIDAMIYMVTSAMGFAALENLFYLMGNNFSPQTNITIAVFRFLGANFLHALCSAILGYFFAKSIINRKKIILISGIIISALLHGIFNYYIMEKNPYFFLYIIAILLILAVSVSKCFRHLKKNNKEFTSKFLANKHL